MILRNAGCPQCRDALDDLRALLTGIGRLPSDAIGVDAAVGLVRVLKHEDIKNDVFDNELRFQLRRCAGCGTDWVVCSTYFLDGAGDHRFDAYAIPATADLIEAVETLPGPQAFSACQDEYFRALAREKG